MTPQTSWSRWARHLQYLLLTFAIDGRMNRREIRCWLRVELTLLAGLLIHSVNHCFLLVVIQLCVFYNIELFLVFDDIWFRCSFERTFFVFVWRRHFSLHNDVWFWWGCLSFHINALIRLNHYIFFVCVSQWLGISQWFGFGFSNDSMFQSLWYYVESVVDFSILFVYFFMFRMLFYCETNNRMFALRLCFNWAQKQIGTDIKYTMYSD